MHQIESIIAVYNYKPLLKMVLPPGKQMHSVSTLSGYGFGNLDLDPEADHHQNLTGLVLGPLAKFHQNLFTTC